MNTQTKNVPCQRCHGTGQEPISDDRRAHRAAEMAAHCRAANIATSWDSCVDREGAAALAMKSPGTIDNWISEGRLTRRRRGCGIPIDELAAIDVASGTDD